MVEHIGDGVAGLEHDEAHRTGQEIGAILAGAIGCHRSAGKRRERAVENPHDRADPDLVRRLGKGVAAALALLGIDETAVAQFGQDMVEELLRDLVCTKGVLSP